MKTKGILITIFSLILISVSGCGKEKKDLDYYNNYLNKLDATKIESIEKGKYELLEISKDEEITIDYINAFESFLLNCGINLNFNPEITNEQLTSNGFIIELEEEGRILRFDYNYLYNNFKDVAPKVKVDQYLLRKTIYEYAGANDLYTNTELLVTWDKYKEILILIDDYVRKYPDEIDIKNDYEQWFDVYIGVATLENNSIYDSNNKLIPEVKAGYEDILNNHKDFLRYMDLQTHYNEHK
ncbi:MAG: hypothetical protein WDA21_02190 [Bacilli bacterium]